MGDGRRALDNCAAAAAGAAVRCGARLRARGKAARGGASDLCSRLFVRHGGNDARPVISAAVVLGIAIISTNSILFSSKSQIRGLTTATGLWSCSLLGLALGAGLYTLALLGFAAILACLSWLPAFETYLKDRSNHFELHLELKSKYNLQDFVTTIRRLGLKIDDIEANPAYLNSGLSVYTVAITISSQELKKYKTHKEIIEALRCLDYIYYIGEL